MKHILFLDDDATRTRKVRQECIGHQVITAETAQQAIAALEAQTFDIVCLDHDLGGNVMAESDENSGYAVAAHIAQMEPERWPRKVIVHSFNPVGAQKMLAALVSNREVEGVTVYPCMFGTLGFWEALGVRMNWEWEE